MTKGSSDEGYVSSGTEIKSQSGSYLSSRSSSYFGGIPIKEVIGEKEQAKDSVVWHVVTFTLKIYACIVASLLVIDVYNNDGRGAIDIVKEAWATFTPIITLALGYMFGKSHSGEGKGE